ncbi:MAG: hypothetical protein NC204_02605 [Candidatus Amulumruptor caecigallinarius]|nr:hypothetical protein [Candidatus Amulumruptor caecigallinarius]
MKFRISDLESVVLQMLDENGEILDERVEFGDPATSVKSLIRTFLPVAALKVVKNFPGACLADCETLLPGVLKRSGAGIATLALPGNFLRLVYLRMKSWNSGVCNTLDSTSDAYRLRVSRMGARYKSPAVSITLHKGVLSLEIFGVADDDEIEACAYLSVPTVDGYYINIPEECEYEVCEEVADMISRINGK